MEAAIRTCGLTKLFGHTRGIDDLDLEVRRGEIFGLLGPSGAGKTTTIRLLLGLIPPSSGWLEVLGLDTRRSIVEVRRRVGYLPGELSLYGRMTGGELLHHLGELRGGVPWGATAELAARLAVDLDHPIQLLSKGDRQKLGLVQALMHDPPLLVLDEPTAGLDVVVQQELHALARERVDAGATVFFTSHVLRDVQQVADRTGIVRAGRLLAIEDAHALRAKASMTTVVVFDRPPTPTAFAPLPGIRDVEVRGRVLRCVVEGDADHLVKALSRHHVVSMTSEEADLEDVLLAHYARGEREAA